MPKGTKPDFEVFVSEKNGDTAYYTRIGAAWRVGNDGISVKLRAIPVDGSLVLFPRREKED